MVWMKIIGTHLILSPMTNLKHLLLIVLVALSNCGCSSVMNDIECRHFIEKYIYIEDINLTYNALGKGEIVVYPYSGHNGDKFCSFLSSGDLYDQYIDLCTKHNDMSYDHTVYVIDSYDFDGTSYAQCDFTQLKVTSDKDYDVDHPKGESLNDLIRFMSFSPNEFIKSGYQKRFDYVNDSSLSNIFREITSSLILDTDELYESQQPYRPIDKLVSELKVDDLILLGYKRLSPLFCLSFEKEPEVKNETHTITIALDSDDGRTFTKSVEVVF